MQKLKLYSDLAEIYDQIYPHLFDYESDAEFVDRILKKHQISEILELGCGSGHLAQRFAQLTKSKDANVRRFVGETLRPIQENIWFYEQPDYSLSILQNLFQERAAYPRTSVGNNLSDLSRKLPELVFNIVSELVASGDKNSYLIAYRACRNLVKKEPVRVLNLLQVDEYKYKKKVYQRSDY